MDNAVSYECMSACILNHMRQRKINLSGSDIFFAGHGYPISYKKGSLTKIKSEGYEANFNFMKLYGIDYQFGRVIPEKEILLGFLREPYAVTIRMVSDALSYDPVFSQTVGASHFINIMDYDPVKKQFFIIDGDVPSAKTGYYSGWMDETDILYGWSQKHGEVLRIDLSEQRDWADFSCEVRAVANRQAEQSIKLYLDGKNKFYSARATGEQAIRCMVKELAKHVQHSGFKEMTLDANFGFRVDGAIGAKLFLLEKMRQKEMSLSKEYEQIVEDWSRWCMLLLKSGLTGKEDSFEFVRTRMEQIVGQERSILERILEEWGDYRIGTFV